MGVGSGMSQLIEMRRRTLMVMILVSLLWGGVMQVPVALGLVSFGAVHSKSNVLFFI